ncbi:ATP-binding protein [Litorilinea aerophila]|uniref:ATP-binding protein n=1 Tax=Litorilinea aerophila TaxID=1204385 RepID=A0A540VGZ9_9CHLR|nr:ATP-binding protein [Litorilinea aerophila]MCC9076438.1 ATP-binding protein [Litorilinea aerophila]OUC06944.1 AAA ATPase [Litorilinea aerophila]
MTNRVSARLMLERHRYFVGRAPELERFYAVVTASELPCFVLHVYGPGGVGKSSLLQEFIYLCEAEGVTAVYLDGRDMEATPALFLQVLALALGLSPASSPLAHLGEQQERFVLLVDTYEQLAPLDRWMRREFLPQMPDNVLVVLAGRNQPSLEWRMDPGWQSLLQVIPLRNLSPDEGRRYLSLRHVPPDQHQAILDLTYGHPLALSLVAEEFAQRPSIRFTLTEATDVIQALLERLVQKVPGPAHRAALEASAMVRVVTEPLLSSMLNLPEVAELFAWLRDLSFVSSGQDGLYLHDLVRDTLAADLRWRNPLWYRELHRRARDFFAGHLEQTHGLEQQRILVDYVFLHRDNIMLRSFLDWQMRDSHILVDRLAPEDPPQVVEMVARHEGEDSARLAAHWLNIQPESVVVYRSDAGELLGFLMMLALPQLRPEERAVDPGVQAVWSYLDQNAPLRPGEQATLFRFWMARETYQDVSAVQSLIFITILQHYLTTPGLAVTFFLAADADFWQMLLAYANIQRLPQVDFTVGGHRYGVYYHDWRLEPPAVWLAVMAEREIAGEQTPPIQPMAANQVLVLSQPDFAAAVWDALRDYTRPDRLAGNPLLRSRLVMARMAEAGEADAPIQALQALLQETAASLRQSPRDLKLHRVLHHTYFQPAATQEAAAELLDLPFSTYRRHLKAGIRRVTDMLWHAELHTG